LLYAAGIMSKPLLGLLFASTTFCGYAQTATSANHPVVLRAARMLDVAGGRMVTPGEVLIEGNRIVAVGGSVTRPSGVEVIELGDTTLMPGLIDVHVHLFLHPGA
jgi:imidazolonepropionase-like amidohydrolase